ncbi:unnamed protein product [Ceratitis capitata]|uniref:(Mediterranean fruit fly) hypothetical protein n=1 Tax=Ceratitis capitata TaxID=7213 RepID=A0A811UJ98_CERCA|nr:unnamed protein product [Ceratitis capitata]
MESVSLLNCHTWYHTCHAPQRQKQTIFDYIVTTIVAVAYSGCVRVTIHKVWHQTEQHPKIKYVHTLAVVRKLAMSYSKSWGFIENVASPSAFLYRLPQP